MIKIIKQKNNVNISSYDTNDFENLTPFLQTNDHITSIEIELDNAKFYINKKYAIIKANDIVQLNQTGENLVWKNFLRNVVVYNGETQTKTTYLCIGWRDSINKKNVFVKITNDGSFEVKEESW